MRVDISVGTRVSARRGPFLPLPDGQRRQNRARVYGWVRASVGEKLWVVAWDDGQDTPKKSAQVAAHPHSAGLPLHDAPSPSIEMGFFNLTSQFGAIIQPAEPVGAPSSGGKCPTYIPNP